VNFDVRPSLFSARSRWGSRKLPARREPTYGGGNSLKLFFAVVHDADAQALTDSLVAAGFRFTHLPTSGGFLRDGNVTFILSVEKDRIGALISIVRRNATKRVQAVNPLTALPEIPLGSAAFPMEIHVGGATIFMFDADRVEKL